MAVTTPDVLQQVLSADLSSRKSKPTDHTFENKALLTIISELVNSPETFLDKIVSIAKELTDAHSAGVNLLKQVDGQEVMLTAAISGPFDKYRDKLWPKKDAPSSLGLKRGELQLLIRPDRYFTNLATNPVIEECLISPIYSADGKYFGTFWLMTHDQETQFDNEDARILKAMTDYVEAFLRANEARQLLTNSEKFFRTTFDYALVGMCIAGLDGKILQANTAFCNLTGYNLEEVTQLDFYEITHPDDRARKRNEVQRMINDETQSFRAEKRYIRKDGSLVWVQNSLSIVRDLDGRPINMIVVAQDINEAKNLQNALSAAKDLAEVANQTKSQFLANMSHEIRTPLGAIIGFTRLLKDPDTSSKDAQEHLNIISRSALALSQLVDDILDLSKVEMGHLEIENRKFSLKELIEELTSLLKFKANEKGIGLRFEFEGDIPSSINSDPTRLRQILINIIGNAIKFTDVGSVTANLKYISENNKNYLIITVTDTGTGIAKDQQPRLFRPFAQADNSMSRKYGGTGLGLELSRRLGRALGGDVELINSEPGKGSTFVIRVEALQQKPDEVSFSTFKTETSNKGDLEHIDLHGTKVLLVEDSPDNQTLIKYILRKTGVHLEIANNGSEGVERAMQDDFDVILMDIQMPILDGYQATTALRRQGFGKPIIALTAHAMKEDRDRCIAAGCDSHLTKPINADELLRTISEWSRHAKALVN